VAAFRSAMGRFPTGVALLTSGSGADAEAVTINCLMSVSLDPLLVGVGVGRGGRILGRMAAGGGFAVNMLAADQRDLSKLFATHDRPTGEAAMRRLGAVVGVTGNAVVPSALASVECEPYAALPGGDHILLLGRVVAIHGDDADAPPLVFHRSRYVTLDA
jgi:flavin reductase (DIM6/NTAB) family NADH-FMN oxidoreductase RutF